MGYYLQAPTPLRKADYLVAECEARLLLEPEYHHGEFTTVCVVNNGVFEAAGIAFDEAEFAAFSKPVDPRPKVWLKLPTKKVVAMCPDVAPYL